MQPNFEVLLKKTKKSIATQLIFTIPFPPDFEKVLPGLHWLICESLSDEWGNAITNGYWESRYNKRSLPQFIEKGLRHGFKNGVWKFLEEGWNLPEAFYKVQVVEEKREFAEHSATSTGPRPNAQIAFWAAKRFKILVPALKSLRVKFKGPQTDTEKLKKEIQKLCSYETYVVALESLLVEGEVTPWISATRTSIRGISLFRSSNTNYRSAASRSRRSKVRFGSISNWATISLNYLISDLPALHQFYSSLGTNPPLVCFYHF